MHPKTHAIKEPAFRVQLLIIGIAWALMQCALYWKNGIITSGEARKYIEQANNIIAGKSLSSNQFWLYATQIVLITISRLLTGGFIFVYIVQLAANAWATIKLYGLMKRYFGYTVSLIGVAIFIGNYPLQEFNSMLQTESLFYSFTVIFSCYLVQLEKLNFRAITIILAWIIGIALTRPTGLLFVPPAFLFLFFRFFQPIRFYVKILLSVAVALLFLFFLNAAIGIGGEFDFMLPYRSECIICGVATRTGIVPINDAGNGNSLYGLLYYIMHNFPQFAKLGGLKSVAFWGLLRSYFSAGHNAFLAIYFYPLYVLVLLSLRWWIKQFAYDFLYFVACVVITWLTVILTCDDWHNRFFLAVSPYLIVLCLPIIRAAAKK